MWTLTALPPRPEPDTRCGSLGDPCEAALKAPVCRPAVRRARAELDAVVKRLVSSDPVDVRGVALVRNLLADGTGPLYQESTADGLGPELQGALEAMEPLP